MTVLNTADNVELGARQVDRVYLGSTLVADYLERQVQRMFAGGEQGGAWKYAPGTLYQDVAGGTPASLVGDPVGRADPIAGSATLQQATAPARPALSQDAAGRWYLQRDGVDDFLATAATFTLHDGWYLAMAAKFQPGTQPALNSGVGLIVSPVDHLILGYRSSAMYRGARVRAASTGGGQAISQGFAGEIAAGQPYVLEADMTPTVLSSTLNGSDERTVSLTGTYGPLPGGTIRFVGESSGDQISDYGFVALDRVPTTTERATIRAWLAGLSGATLP